MLISVLILSEVSRSSDCLMGKAREGSWLSLLGPRGTGDLLGIKFDGRVTIKAI